MSLAHLRDLVVATLVFHPQQLHLSARLCERVDLHCLEIVDQSRESVISVLHVIIYVVLCVV